MENNLKKTIEEISSICASGNFPLRVYGGVSDVLPKIATIDIPRENLRAIGRTETDLLTYFSKNNIVYEIEKVDKNQLPSRYVLTLSRGQVFDNLEFDIVKELFLEERAFNFYVSKEYGGIYHNYDFDKEYDFRKKNEPDFIKFYDLRLLKPEARVGLIKECDKKLKKQHKKKFNFKKFYTNLKNKFMAIPFIDKYNKKKEHEKALKQLNLVEDQIRMAGLGDDSKNAIIKTLTQKLKK